MVVSKHCPKCDRELASDAFTRNSQTKSGLETYCRECRAALNKTRWPKYYSGKKQEIADRQRAYRARNPESHRNALRRRKVTKAGQPVEDYNRSEIRLRDGGKCWWCLIPLGDDWHVDHLVPIQSENTPLRDRPGDVRINVVASCPSCNTSRCNREDAWADVRLLEAWYKEALN